LIAYFRGGGAILGEPIKQPRSQLNQVQSLSHPTKQRQRSARASIIQVRMCVLHASNEDTKNNLVFSFIIHQTPMNCFSSSPSSSSSSSSTTTTTTTTTLTTTLKNCLAYLTYLCLKHPGINWDERENLSITWGLGRSLLIFCLVSPFVNRASLLRGTSITRKKTLCYS